MSGFELQWLGMLMEPEPGNPQEIEGVLNPAAARGPDGELYLFPRLVAHGNYSRIGIARVRFNEAGDPAGVERLGIALEPEADYELRPDGSGGCEDPRITFVEPLQRYVIRYRSAEPVLTPEVPEERRGTVANVVFPTGIDRRDDLGSQERFDVYYGMADYRIGVARLEVPDVLPPGRVADSPEAKV
jgi:predicted GH43/DUF377 family glycosyl hydrolase